MIGLAAALSTVVLAASDLGAGWRCTGALEVTCAEEGCAAAPDGEFTPMSVSVDAVGGLSACAYSGCWEGTAHRVETDRRLIWTADDLTWRGVADIDPGQPATLVIIPDALEAPTEHAGRPKARLGFIAIAGFANPLICEAAG